MISNYAPPAAAAFKGIDDGTVNLLKYKALFIAVNLVSPTAVSAITVKKSVPMACGVGHNSKIERAIGLQWWRP